MDVDGVSDNSGTEDEADEAQGQRKATKNSSKQIGRGGGQAKRKRSYVRSKSGDSPLLILDEDDGWSGLPSWLRQWVSDGADMLKCTSLVTSMVRIGPPLATTLQRSLRCSGLQ